ncbi:MAG: Lrp/AsnC family transcriptional regulator [Armatimonadota bacterium]|nr:Lrp/AsnC family transcriptional regulator [Armatimonadota bacterium]
MQPNTPNSPDEILTILARDARTSPEMIATLTGREVAEVRAAITDYERHGIIKHYKTIVDWEKAGVEKVFAFIDVKVLPARDVGFDGVAERIYRHPEVHSVWLISGNSDLRIVVEGRDMRDVGRFVAQSLSTIDGVTGTDTHFMMRRYKEDQTLFVDSEEDPRLVVTP